MATLTFAKIGKVTLEWLPDDTLKIIREDNMQHIEISISEWAVILRIAAIHGWPVCPPITNLEED